MKFVIIIFGDVGRLSFATGELDFFIHNDSGWRPILLTHFESGKISEWFDNTAGLARGQRHIYLAIDFIIVEIGRTNQCQDVT